MNRNRFLAAGTSLAAAPTIFRAPARAAQFEFKCGADLPADQPSSARMAQMWVSVEQESAGRVRTQFFPGSTLGGMTAMLGQLRVGALHFLMINPGNLASVVPSADVAYTGFAFTSVDEGAKVMAGAPGDYVRKEALTKGLYAFRSTWDNVLLQVGSATHAIHTPEDMTGFKIRVQGGAILTNLFKTLDASPVPVSLSETYTALQTKLVDGEALSLTTIEATRLYEVNKFISLTNHSWNGDWLIANADVWKSLPPDMQDLIERNNTKFALLDRNDLRTLNTTVGKRLTGQGVTINTVDPAPFRRRLKPYYDSVVGILGPTVWGLLQDTLGHRLG